MKSPKVRLYIRVLVADGRNVYSNPVWNKNRTLKAGFAEVDSKLHPEGIYYLRFVRDGKRVWEAVGREPDAALMSVRKTEHNLQSISLGLLVPTRTASDKKPDAPTPISLQDAIQDYLENLKRFRASGTSKGAEHMLTRFGARFPGRLLNDIGRKDLLKHMDGLKADGLGNRTISNHLIRIEALLREHAIAGLLSVSDKPRYEEREVEAYSSRQLESLFAAATPEERMTYEFFLGTGLREREVMFTTWRHIDFEGKVVAVRSKPEMGFNIKDKEERSVPIPDSLVASLTERRKRSTSMLVFPSKRGTPNGHLLRTLQKLAFRAGLNCGECVTKGGQNCMSCPSCGSWGLHKFRKTFATMHSDAGVSARTIQRWLGHSDLATTLRYLAVADIRSERTRNQVNTSFALLNMGRAAR